MCNLVKMNKWDAQKARRMSLNNKDYNPIKEVIIEIYDACCKGKTSLKVEYLTSKQKELLEELGYKVRLYTPNVFDSNFDYYTISW